MIYIGLTGNALDSDIDYFLSCGANEVMTKPFDLSRFQEIIKNYDVERRVSSLFSPLTDTTSNEENN
jgi:CheY-like chemotaxis protein